MGGNRRHNSGLTLIEMLAVLAIIVIIASAVVVAGVGLWNRSQRDGTRAIIEGLVGAIEAYAAQFDGYCPPDNQVAKWRTHPHHGNNNLYYSLKSTGHLDWLSSRQIVVDSDSAMLIVDTYRRPLVYNGPYDDGVTDTPFVYKGYTLRAKGGTYMLFSLGDDGLSNPVPPGHPAYDPDMPQDDIRNYQELE